MVQIEYFDHGFALVAAPRRSGRRRGRDNRPTGGRKVALAGKAGGSAKSTAAQAYERGCNVVVI
jgi:hypothetical protein